ncbi:GntR family transcriptional regulator [Georgenia alba]|uniref:GntR family transcriptional regulator n=1 Tax=Georgenia alba TaxID=2233858 RepID=A0ABW2Q7W3_9MICO
MAAGATDEAGDGVTSGTGHLAQAIREAIISGEFAPHQRLIETDLSTTYGASRAAVRTALLELAGEGLVDRMPHRGSRVRAITVEDAIEILEVRIGVESLCAAKAAERIEAAEIEEFRQLREDLLASVSAGDLMRYSELNRHLDKRIREVSRHQVASDVLSRLHAQSIRHQFRLSFQPARAARSAPEHAAIIDAIVARDPDAAAEATRAHLESVIEALRA